MKVKVYKPDIIIALLLMVYVLGQNILYLVSVSNNYNLIAYIVLALLTGYAICVGNGLKIEKSGFTLLMLSPFVLSLLASVIEVILYRDASLITSFRR